MTTRPPTPDQPANGPDEIRIVVHDGPDAPVPDALDAGPDPRSAPAGAPAGPASPQLFTVPTVTRAVEAGFGIVAERRGEHWHVSEAEAESIAEPLTGELNDLTASLPFHDSIAGAMGGRRMQLAAALAFVTGPRLVADYQIAGQRAAAVRAAALASRERPVAETPDRPPTGGGMASILANTPAPGAA